MSTPAYPLQWPAGWDRTSPQTRTRARFGAQDGRWGRRELSVADAVSRVLGELRRMDVGDWQTVISTNLTLRNDGLPRSTRRAPDDPGAAVYWRDGRADGWPQRCMAIDRYDRVADNLAAIAATLAAMRAIERHGGAEILNRALTGFAALPDQHSEAWYIVLGLSPDASRAAIEAAWRRLRSQCHPDRGGDADTFQRLQQAYREATARE